MKLAVWMTGHAICDTVAQSLARGFDADLYHVSQLTDDCIRDYDGHIAYGILRGTADVFKNAERNGRAWFNVDKGYWNAGHFAGAYRLSHKGTQCRWHGERVRLAVSQDALTLIAPPTADVCKFFNVDPVAWLRSATIAFPNHKLRWKGETKPIDWSVEQLATFNSSLGWQALERGIPCISDSLRSIVGSYFAVDSKPQVVQGNCEPLFTYMRKHQFTLQQIEEGRAWALIRDYLST